ncbi:MAG: hypothetical protein EOL88_13820 [Bacteroidia bacterium]|nr:hypothetical protein [Bacteroidia bacterium]
MKINLFRFASAALMLLLMYSCSSIYSDGYKKSPEGVIYKFYSQADEGKMPVIGDYVQVQMVYAYEDSTLFDTRDSKRDFEMRVEESLFEGDIYAAVRMMKEGDSASFLMDAMEFYTKLFNQPDQPAPEFVEEGGKMTFDLLLEKVMTEEEHEMEIQNRIAKRKSDEPIILQKYLSTIEQKIDALESGLYFINIREGNAQKPKAGDMLTINMKVMLMDGTVLYDSWQEQQPLQFEYGKRFDTQGLVEGISLMHKGQVAHLIVPSHLAFGEFGRQGFIEPYSTLLYDVELIDFQSKEEIEKLNSALAMKNKKEGEVFLAKNALQEGVIVLPSGLQYQVIESGSGTVSPSASSRVRVHYTGTLIDGRKFDSSYDRGKPAEFAVNGVIKGWTEALQQMKAGDKWKLFIPSNLAYGENPRPGGIIEPNMVLLFDVELIEIVE